MNKRNRSASGIEEDARHLGFDALIRPVRVLIPYPRRLHLPRGPVELLRQPQAFLAGHRSQDSYLLRGKLFIAKHGKSVVESTRFRRRARVNSVNVTQTPNSVGDYFWWGDLDRG